MSPLMHPQEQLLLRLLSRLPEFAMAGFSAAPVRRWRGINIRFGDRVRGTWRFENGIFVWHSLATAQKTVSCATAEQATKATMEYVLQCLTSLQQPATFARHGGVDQLFLATG